MNMKGQMRYYLLLFIMHAGCFHHIASISTIDGIHSNSTINDVSAPSLQASTGSGSVFNIIPSSFPSPTMPSQHILNVALGKNATQSTTFCCKSGFHRCCPTGFASRAVDGDTAGFRKDRSMSQTQPGELNPWWKVDLGDLYPIEQIKIFKRLDPYYLTRRKEFVLKIYNRGDVVMTYESPIIPPNVTTVDFLPIIVGDEVEVSMTGKKPLCLAEVEVYAGDPIEAPSLTPTISAPPSTSLSPTMEPSISMSPSTEPTGVPSSPLTSAPSISTSPTAKPTENPSTSPTTTPSTSQSPTMVPSVSTSPSAEPTGIPSFLPTSVPSISTSPTAKPTENPSSPPTSTPSLSTSPTVTPTENPTNPPTSAPSTSISPTANPTENPTKGPSSSPSEASSFPSASPSDDTPNVIMIMTDEHNFRTLGSYRRYYKNVLGQPSQAHVWGSENFVHTPNLDLLADTGALFSNFYTVTPLCTPSRASFMSGLYPAFTGESDLNHGRMDDDITTFAQVLQDQRGFFTSYLGKWHLNGEASPGWYDSRKFGFRNRHYQYNRGHWKYLSKETDGKVQEYTRESANGKFADSEEKHFTTDFLFDRGMEHISNALRRDEKFAVVYSIPDPHGPNQVRKPYDTMYTNLNFTLPDSGKAAMRKFPAGPIWNHVDHEHVALADADVFLEQYESSRFYQNHLQQYFGMVKCIDDNIGKLLKFLENKGVRDDTIIIFTSDHGDMLFEHGKMNKGRPYEASAGIPFIVNWPKRISPKIIETPYSSVDFYPTLLGLVGVEEDPSLNLHGIDASPDLLSQKSMISNDDHIVFTFDADKRGAWAASMMKGYKLVVSRNDRPWLFDLYADPDEVFNFFESPSHSQIVSRLQTALFDAISKYKAPLGVQNKAFFWDTPACTDSLDAIRMDDGQRLVCQDVGTTWPVATCRQTSVVKACGRKCGVCCLDSVGKLWFEGKLKMCGELIEQCHIEKVQAFCPSMCNACQR